MVRLAIGICYMRLRESKADAIDEIESFLATVVADISEQFREEAERLFSEENQNAD